ncbi:hypothetical protein AG1IA_05552 [Rhizoctonia solani AG-1 IA]|uniref:Uncharacterized protein n=1 Tax=Thanatephorus cucumeris (strain AG1-IA) TaxID=983506 RepID=L8WUI6_THACA|nr:hypothetical protein AG1IA_05552 [Rhizoctonia solani AG-1 IA]
MDRRLLYGWQNRPIAVASESPVLLTAERVPGYHVMRIQREQAATLKAITAPNNIKKQPTARDFVTSTVHQICDLMSHLRFFAKLHGLHPCKVLPKISRQLPGLSLIFREGLKNYSYRIPLSALSFL